MSTLDLGPLASDPGTDLVQIARLRNVGAGKVAHHLVYPSTELTPQYSSALLARLLCYYLIDLVPDEGLRDAVSSLGETLDFYATSPGGLPGSEDQHQYLHVTIGKTFQSPGFEIDTD